MADWVTIKGSTTPCWEVERGEIREVQFDDHVQRLINGGFVEVVEWHTDDPEPEPSKPAPLEPEVGPDESE